MMMAKILVDGKEFDIEILDPKLQELLAPSKKKTGYERVGKSERYYYATDDGSADDFCEDWDEEGSEEYYNGANYYSDASVAANNSRADKLMRQLRRFAVEHREETMCWNAKSQKYLINYDYNNHMLSVDYNGEGSRVFGAFYFDTREQAQLAINTFRDELIWYFTEYKDSL